MGWSSRKPRYGIAELYVERPGYESAQKVSRKKKIHNAISFIIDDPKGSEGRILIARLLGKHMTNIPDADVEDYLLTIAEKILIRLLICTQVTTLILGICLLKPKINILFI